MKFKQTDESPKTFILIFEIGDKLAERLHQFAKEQKLSAASFKTVGALSSLRLGWFSWETLGRLGDLVQFLADRVKQKWTALVLFRIALNADSVCRYLCSLVKTINRLQTEAARTGESPNNGRELKASRDRSVMIRVPLLVVSLRAQCLVLLVA